MRSAQHSPQAAVDRALRVLRCGAIIALHFDLHIVAELPELLVQLLEKFNVFGRQTFECVQHVRVALLRRLVLAARFLRCVAVARYLAVGAVRMQNDDNGYLWNEK